jgi:hypothetical protein
MLLTKMVDGGGLLLCSNTICFAFTPQKKRNAIETSKMKKTKNAIETSTTCETTSVLACLLPPICSHLSQWRREIEKKQRVLLSLRPSLPSVFPSFHPSFSLPVFLPLGGRDLSPPPVCKAEPRPPAATESCSNERNTTDDSAYHINGDDTAASAALAMGAVAEDSFAERLKDDITRCILWAQVLLVTVCMAYAETTDIPTLALCGVSPRSGIRITPLKLKIFTPE